MPRPPEVHESEGYFPEADYHGAAEHLAQKLLTQHNDVKLSERDLHTHIEEMGVDQSVPEFVFERLQFQQSLVPEAFRDLAEMLHLPLETVEQEVEGLEKLFHSDEEYAVRMQAVGLFRQERIAPLPSEELSEMNKLILSAAAPMNWMDAEGNITGITANPEDLTLSQFEYMRLQKPFFLVMEDRPVWVLRIPDDFLDEEEVANAQMFETTLPKHYLAVPNSEVNRLLSSRVFKESGLLKYFLEQPVFAAQQDLYAGLRMDFERASHGRREELYGLMDRANALLRNKFFRSLWQDIEQAEELQFVSVFRDEQDVRAINTGARRPSPEGRESHAVVYRVRKAPGYSGSGQVLEFEWVNPFLKSEDDSGQQKGWVKLENDLLLFSPADKEDWASQPGISTDWSSIVLHDEFEHLQLLDFSSWMQDPAKAHQFALEMAKELETAGSSSELLERYKSYWLSQYPTRERMIFPKDLKVEFTDDLPPSDLLMEQKFSRN